MINEKEALSKLFIDLCKIQEDFSKIFPPAPEVITLDNSSEEGLEIYNKISILIDNVWWSGKIIDEKQQDKKTKALREFNQKIKEDTRIEQIFLPFRDGLFWVRKL